MSHPPDDPIAPEEILYRRIPKQYYDQIASEQRIPLPDAALRPNEQDVTGMSFFRAKYRKPESLGRPGKPFFVAEFRVSTLVEKGIAIQLTPGVGGPGHVELPQITFANRKSVSTLELRNMLAKSLCSNVLGPFD